MPPEDELVPNFVREITLAVQTWEKRAKLEGITFEGTAPHLYVSLHWRVADDAVGEIYRTQFKAA